MRETIYHNGGVSFRGASGEMILHRLDLKKIYFVLICKGAVELGVELILIILVNCV